MWGIDVAVITAVLLLTIRLGAMALSAPPLGARFVPPTVRVAFVIALSVALAGGGSAQVSLDPVSRLPTLGWIVSAAAAELAAGLVLGLGLNAAVAAFTMAGRLVDVQIGFGMGQVWDPGTQQHMPVVAAAFTQLALLSFFLLHADHALLRGVALSVQSHPPGTVSQALTDPTNAARLLTQTFSLGFAMVAPVMFVLLLVEFGLGVLARNLPQMNMLVIGVPVKTLVGVAALASFSLAAQGPMARAYTAAFDFVGRAWR